MLLGSGELGKEFTIAAKRAGQYVIACDKYDNAPAMQVADEREVFSMLDGDALTALLGKFDGSQGISGFTTLGNGDDDIILRYHRIAVTEL